MIDGKAFDPVSVMDSPNTIAIKGDKNDLTGKNVRICIALNGDIRYDS